MQFYLCLEIEEEGISSSYLNILSLFIYLKITRDDAIANEFLRKSDVRNIAAFNPEGI
jgi:hypothetical protein